ncbi:MAG: right-handed parallel beta-helix repeat-containing protein [Elusimicrobiota bacterium]
MKKLFPIPIFLFLASCFLLPASCLHATDVSGIISADATWTLANSPYNVTGNTLVEAGVTLTIASSVIVKFYIGTYLRVDGTLKAEGTASNHIIFTSTKTTPAAGDWGRIKFTDTSVDANCIIKYCELKYATDGIYCENASPTISNNIISTNTNYGIYCSYSSPSISSNTIPNNTYGIYCYEYSSPSISNNTITNNTNSGIYCYWSSPSISNNTITNNTNYGIYCSYSSPSISTNTITGSSIGIKNDWNSNPTITYNNNYSHSTYSIQNLTTNNITSTYNWWGTTNTTEIDAKIYDYYDDFENGKVLYSPFLGGALFVPPAAISDLTALTGTLEGEILLNWTSPGDDGTVGQIVDGRWEIKYSSVGIITNSNYGSPPNPTYTITITTTGINPLSHISYLISDLLPGVTYWFAIKTKDNANNWAVWNSSADVLTINTAAYAAAQDWVPSQPSGLTSLASDTEIQLWWTANPDVDISFYRIYCDSHPPDTIDWFIVGTTFPSPTQTNPYSHTGLTNGSTYFYKITAVDKTNHESSYSTTVSTKPYQKPPLAPSNFYATSVAVSSIQWQFTDNANNEDGLYISSGTSIFCRLSSNLGPSPGTGSTVSWWETGFSPNTQYTRYAEAVNAAGSSWSVAISSYTAANPPTATSTSTIISADKENIVIIPPSTETGEMEVVFPEGSFTEDVAVTASMLPLSEIPVSTQENIKLTNVGVEIIISKPLQPQKEITITLTYTDTQAYGLDESRFVIGYYREATKHWIPIPSTPYPDENKVIGKTNHISKFAILQLVPAKTLDNVLIYPNPFRPGKGHKEIKFTNLTENCKIQILTLSGNIVWEKEDIDLGETTWRVTNQSGRELASGVYICVITNDQNRKKICNLCVIR